MRILYLHQYFVTRNMVGGTRSFEFARRLVKAGHEVHVITSSRQNADTTGGDWRVSNEDGITVHWVTVPYSNQMGYADRIKAFFKFAWLAGRRAAGIPADLVFASSTPLTIALPAVFAARRQKVPMVLEVRDLWPQVPIRVGVLRSPLTIAAARWLERFAYRNATSVVALSPGMKEGVVAAGYPPERVSVIPNSCDMDLFDIGPAPGRELRQRHEWLGDRPLVVYTGTLGLINGVKYMASLAAAVRPLNPDMRFLVIGEGREYEQVREFAGRLGVLKQNFFMMKSVPKQALPEWLSAATFASSWVLDLPEFRANSANKFFDALASGKPVLINHGGWQADLLTESGAGLVLDPHDFIRAAAALVAAAADPGWLAQSSAAARELAVARFHRDKLAAQLEQVLLQSASGKDEQLDAIGARN